MDNVLKFVLTILLVTLIALSCLKFTAGSERGDDQKGLVVYANKEISANSMIRTEAIFEKKINYKDIPIDAEVGGQWVAGRLAKVTIKCGSIICQHHLLPFPLKPSPAFQADEERESKKADKKFSDKE